LNLLKPKFRAAGKGVGGSPRHLTRR